MLKIKAKIYYYTGIYLAHKEENKYLESAEFWRSMHKITNGKDKDLRNPRQAQSLLISLWQVKNGFCRPMSFWNFFIRQVKWRMKAWIIKMKHQKGQGLTRPQESLKPGKISRQNNK